MKKSQCDLEIDLNYADKQYLRKEFFTVYLCDKTGDLDRLSFSSND